MSHGPAGEMGVEKSGSASGLDAGIAAQDASPQTAEASEAPPWGFVESAGEVPEWHDVDFTEPEPPEEWSSRPRVFADENPPPQLIHTLNLLSLPQHDVASADDLQGIADSILARAKEGVADVFAHDDYNSYDGPTEAWARAVAEHQTGIPYTMPVYFYDGPQKKIAAEIALSGRYPLVGQCQQSVTSALCIGGWDGGAYGDIGSGVGSLPYCKTIGTAWERENVPAALDDWPDELWNQVTVGSCLFWAAPCPLTKDGVTCGGGKHVVGCGVGSGHVAMVLRKHPTERKWQLWDTGTSFYDPRPHAGAQKGARMLWESHWWAWIPKTISTNWSFRGIGLVAGLGDVRSGLKPRGRCRLILRRRSDRALLYRSPWLSMETEGLPIMWLLRSLRGAPFFETIEPTWCVNSARDVASASLPDNRAILDCTCDARGNARMSWRPDRGLHDRSGQKDWAPEAPFIQRPSSSAQAQANKYAASDPATPARKMAAAIDVYEEAEKERAIERAAEPLLKSEDLRGNAGLLRIASGQETMKQGASGASVKTVQAALLAAGLEVKGGADGAFGEATLDAVKALQTECGLDAIGVVDASTLLLLDAKLAGASSTA